jgi:hypothetical protein
VRWRVIRCPLATHVDRLPSNWQRFAASLGTSYFLPPRSTFWVSRIKSQRHYIHPTRYGSVGFYSLGLCYKKYGCFERRFISGCPSRHSLSLMSFYGSRIMKQKISSMITFPTTSPLPPSETTTPGDATATRTRSRRHRRPSSTALDSKLL